MPLRDWSLEQRATARQNWYTEVGHVPKLGQRLLDEAVDAGKRFIGFFTPPQDGKSFHVARHCGSLLLFPNTYGWLIGPTYEDAKKEFGYLWADFGKVGLLRTAKDKHYDVRGGNMRIELKNGSWVQVVSANEEENLRREQLDFVVYCEASKLKANLHKEHVYSRIERRGGLVFAPTTFKGYNWVHRDFRVPSLPTKDKTGKWTEWTDGRRERIGGEPNPDYDEEFWSCQVSYVPEFGDVLHTGEYPPEVIAKARLRLPPPMFAEAFGGEAASYAGLVYPFDPAVHECAPFRIPDGWTHVVGYDHGAGGGSDPTAILFGSYGPDGTLYWWSEIYDEQVRAISSRASHLRIVMQGKRPAAIMRGRDAKQVGKELADAGVPTSFPFETDVAARIIRMTELMKTGHWKILRGCCPNLRREVLEYEWDEKNPGSPRDGNDHCLEAAGYASLAPVSLPDATQAVPDEAPKDRATRIARDRLWGAYEREQRAGQRNGKVGRLESLLEPNPLEETGVVADWVAR